MSSTVSSVSSAVSNAVSTYTSSDNSLVSQDTFLKLLITQLKNQDPLDPQDSTQFISQLASFSSLEQMSEMSDTMETVLELSATSIIGKTVEVLDSTGNLVNGVVDGITYYADGPAVSINGTDYAFSQVQNISATESE